jgi:hypothetical protein
MPASTFAAIPPLEVVMLGEDDITLGAEVKVLRFEACGHGQR